MSPDAVVYFTVVTLGDARAGGTPIEVCSKKKGCHKDDLTGFSGRLSLGQPFFFTMTADLDIARAWK